MLDLLRGDAAPNLFDRTQLSFQSSLPLFPIFFPHLFCLNFVNGIFFSSSSLLGVTLFSLLFFFHLYSNIFIVNNSQTYTDRRYDSVKRIDREHHLSSFNSFKYVHLYFCNFVSISLVSNCGFNGQHSIFRLNLACGTSISSFASGRSDFIVFHKMHLFFLFFFYS